MRRAKGAENGVYGGPWGHATGACGTFRTVSPRTLVGMEGNEHGTDVQSSLESSPLERLLPPLSAQLGGSVVAAVV
jgi:hypothetical protein